VLKNAEEQQKHVSAKQEYDGKFGILFRLQREPELEYWRSNATSEVLDSIAYMILQLQSRI